MDERNATYLFLVLLIIIDFVHSVPKIDDKLQSAKKSLRQGLPESIESVPPPPKHEVERNLNKNQGRDDDDEQEEDENREDVVDDNVNNNKDNDDTATRSIVVGDTFTTPEMWEITKRLIRKVKFEGKGFVSSAKNAYELADRLFEAYFLTLKRIVIIRDVDIAGLDALQALSLNNDVVDSLRTSINSFTESPSTLIKSDLYDDQPQKCHYKVLKKPIKSEAKNKIKKLKRRQAARLKKKLGKNRKVIVNPGSSGIDKNNKNSPRGVKNKRTDLIKKTQRTERKTSTKIASNKKSQRNTNNKKALRTNNKLHGQKKNTKRQSSLNYNGTITHHQKDTGLTCRWKYGCLNPINLNTCRLRPLCKNETDDQNAGFNNEDIKLRTFRRMIGMDVIDEEVEKILEAHIILLQINSENNDKKIESLSEYFNRIVDSEDQPTTPAMVPDTDHDAAETDHEEEGSKFVSSESHQDDDDAEARRILGLPVLINGYNATGPPSNKH